MNQPAEKLVADVKVLASDVEALVRATSAQSGEKLAAARQRLQVALASAGDVMAVRGRTAVETTNRYVRENPWTMTGLAVAAGAVLGFLIGRR